MLSIEKLKGYGADTEKGVAMCVGNEELYLTFVQEVSKDPNFEKLEEALKADDLSKAFEAAHALKGVLANLFLTPLSATVAELSDLLKAKTAMDYTALLNKVKEEREQLIALF